MSDYIGSNKSSYGSWKIQKHKELKLGELGSTINKMKLLQAQNDPHKMGGCQLFLDIEKDSMRLSSILAGIP